MEGTVSKVTKFTKKQLKKAGRLGFDYNLLFILLFLLIWGLIMVYSASSAVAVRDFGKQNHYLRKQMIADGIGLVAMLGIMFLNYRIYNKRFVYRWFFYLLALLLPLLTIPFGIESHSASRWVQIPGTGFNFQPAEASKLCLIMFMAAWLSSLKERINETKEFWISVALPVPIAGVIYFVTDNLSSAIIVMAIGVMMVFVASRDYKRFAICAGVIAAAVVGIVIYVENAGAKGSFRLGRIYSWLHPENTLETTSHQTIQALYAIGSGGIWGKGLGESVQKLSALPEPHNDMIFAIICEELGIVGAIALILVFVLLVLRIYMIARETRNRYGFMLVVGVLCHISLQIILNIAVATNSMPNTGVSLPFVSYGGTSVCFLLAEMGLVFSVNRANKNEE